jgi:hypothetical protein
MHTNPMIEAASDRNPARKALMSVLVALPIVLAMSSGGAQAAGTFRLQGPWPHTTSATSGSVLVQSYNQHPRSRQVRAIAGKKH